MQDRIRDIINFIYEEGEIDFVFMAQIMGYMTYDANDRRIERSTERRLSSALQLVEYLVDLGDFYAGRSITTSNGRVIYDSLEGRFPEFLSELNEVIYSVGLESIEFNYGFWIKKKNIHSKFDGIIEKQISNLLD